MSQPSDWTQIVDVLNGYASALDARSWDGLDEVFADDVFMDFGVWQASSRDEAVEKIRSFLGGCGPSQHLLGNYEIHIDGDRATARVYVRAFHIGRGDRKHLTYEMGGEYQDELVRTSDGWRITRRLGLPHWVQGDASILGPGKD